MDLIFILIPISILIVATMVWFFIWAVDHGQYEDLDQAAVDALSDADDTQPNHSTPSLETPENGR